MESKSKPIVTKGKSDKYITAENNQWRDAVKYDANNISKAKKQYDGAMQDIDKADDLLNKVNGYRDQRDAYKARQNEIDKDQAELKKAKRKSTKKKLEDDIKSKTKDKKALAKRMSQIASKAGFQKEMDSRKRALQKAKTAKKNESRLSSLKAKDKKKYEKYHKALLKEKAAKRQKTQKANSKKINDKISAAKKLYQGRTAVYRSDLMSSRVFMLAEMAPSENVNIDVNANPVDSSDPRTNYTVEESKELSGTYYLYGKSFTDRDQQYSILQGWARKGYGVAVRGFSQLDHCKLQTVTKTVDTPYKNVLELNLTFSYVLPAKIDYAKTKSKSKSKAKTGKTKGKSKQTKRVVKLKPGMTLLEIARKMDVPYSDLKKKNGALVAKGKAASKLLAKNVRYE